MASAYDLAAARAPTAIRALLVGQRRDVEQLGDALPALDLDEQHPAAAGGQRQRERGGHGRLAGAALAGDDVQPDAVPVDVARQSAVGGTRQPSEGRAPRRGAAG